MDLSKYNRIYLDSPVFIYFFEDSEKYSSVVEPIFQEVANGNVGGISSYVSLLEILVKPFQQKDFDLVQQYRDYLVNSAFLNLYPVDEAVAGTAAGLRAKYSGHGQKLRTPDAIQIATGVISGADVFITNDKRLRQITEIEILVLDDFIS